MPVGISAAVVVGSRSGKAEEPDTVVDMAADTVVDTAAAPVVDNNCRLRADGTDLDLDTVADRGRDLAGVADTDLAAAEDQVSVEVGVAAE